MLNFDARKGMQGNDEVLFLSTYFSGLHKTHWIGRAIHHGVYGIEKVVNHYSFSVRDVIALCSSGKIQIKEQKNSHISLFLYLFD